jgi:hypothetical protein
MCQFPDTAASSFCVYIICHTFAADREKQGGLLAFALG